MSRLITTEIFIKESEELHNFNYNYSKVTYNKAVEKVIIGCPVHGEFSQTPSKHLQGKGCAKCSKGRHDEKRTYTTKEFIKLAKEVHGDKYSYENVDYINSRSKVEITCSTHKKFTQNPSVHLLGRGCFKCSREKGSWSHTQWQKAGEKSKHFDSFKVYIIKCWNEEEEFYKIGKTYHTVERRFSSKSSMPYNWDIVKVFKGVAKEISELEKQLQKENKESKYYPDKKFGGIHECFKIITI